MAVKADLVGASYVAVEIIKKAIKDPTKIYSGLLMGICSRKNDKNEEHKFITIVTAKDTIRLFNKLKYDIVSIDVITYNTKYTTVFNKSDKDQNEAITDLEEISNHMIKTEKMGYYNDTRKELINPVYYKEYPNELIGRVADKNHIVRNTNEIEYIKKNENKEPVLGKIKRKGKLPNKVKLEDIKSKVKKIATGKYKIVPIPIPDCDKKEKNYNYTIGL